MNEVCRLCLTVSTQFMYRLYEKCDILSKIWSCMSIQITLNDFLPNQICMVCMTKIEEIYEFHKIITQNEQKLLHHITFAEDKKNFTKINGKKAAITEHDDYDTQSHNNLCDPDIKHDENNYSSEDEITLSKIKHEKKETIMLKHKHKYFENMKTNNRVLKNNIRKNKRDSKKAVKEPNLYNNTELGCLTCFKNFESQTELIKHYHNDHNNGMHFKNDHGIIKTDNGIKKADNDNPKADDKSEKYTTKISDNGRVMYECCKCMKQYDKKKDIAGHVVSHDSNRPFLCKFCGRTYKTVYEIIRHSRAHSGTKLHCSHSCGFSTAYRGALKEHEKRHETPEYKYTCEKCGKGYQAKTWYEQHQNVHSGLKPFVCDICGLAFHMDRYLTAHRSAVHPQTSKVKRYVCVHCLLPCDSRNSLKRHLEEHGIKTTFLCDLCGKVFTNAELLKYHKNGHLGVKPHSCRVCNKTFVKKFNLKIHELTHTGERAHACVKCGKYFTQRSTLLRHNRRHHPETQFKDAAVEEDTTKTSE